MGLVLIGTSAFYILRDLPPQAEDLSALPIEVDYPAPELTLTDIDGVERSLAEYRGQGGAG